jgi:hypothetical protein
MRINWLNCQKFQLKRLQKGLKKGQKLNKRIKRLIKVLQLKKGKILIHHWCL